jgi:hypothetical protein
MSATGMINCPGCGRSIQVGSTHMCEQPLTANMSAPREKLQAKFIAYSKIERGINDTSSLSCYRQGLFEGCNEGARIALQLALEEIKKREIKAGGTPLGIVTIKAVEGVFGEIGGE